MADYAFPASPYDAINRRRLDELMGLLRERLSATDYERACRLIEATFCPRRGASLNAEDAAKAAAA